MGRFEEAEVKGREALAVACRLGLKRSIAAYNNNLGELYKDQKRWSEALSYYLESYHAAVEAGAEPVVANTINNIGMTLIELGRPDEALEWLGQGLTIAEKTQQLKQQYLNYRYRAHAYEAKGEYDKAFANFRKHQDLRDLAITEETRKKIVELQTKFKYESKIRDAEIYRLRNVELKNSNRRLRNALERVKVLSGLVPICAHCKKIRDDKGFWTQLEVFIAQHSDAVFSHGVCPDCMRQFYPDLLSAKKELSSKRSYR